MRQFTLLLLLLHRSLAQSFAKDKICVIDNRSLENKRDHQLVHDLLHCGYNMFKAPELNHTERLVVKLHLGLRKLHYKSEEQKFSPSTWTFLKWNDKRLKWDPKKYDGIDKAVFSSASIWMPGIRLFNGIGDEYDYRYYVYVPCEARSSGDVMCIAALVWDATCGSDLSDWPFDAQTCKLEFGPFLDTTVKIQLDVASKAISMIGAEDGAAWDIMDYQQEVHNNSEKQVAMTFRLKHRTDVLTAIIIFPAFILSILTLSTLLIDARSNTRLLLICFSLMCHFYFLSELAADIPKHTKNSPRLPWYYRGSFVMTSISIVVSFILKLICTKEMACPNWIISCNNFVYMNSVKFLIRPRWKTTVEETCVSEVVKGWTDFANIMNTVWIVVSVVVYISMYCTVACNKMYT